ncbi:MAG TPA: hypothetical protein VJ208_04265 [Candidatus Nanoarchaeia archaeon]|nr:hypothetical protein [Candidatus Nanoarchaeia archaeon]
MFDRTRKVRNAINYYSRGINEEEAKQIIREIKLPIDRLRG